MSRLPKSREHFKTFSRVVFSMQLVVFLLHCVCHAQSQVSAPSLSDGTSTTLAHGAESAKDYGDFALHAEGDAGRGWAVFTNTTGAACVRCHTTDGSAGKVAPDLFAIADKFSKQDLIRAVLEPSATIAIGYETTILETKSEAEFSGIIKHATDKWVDLMGWDAQVYHVPTAEIVSRRTTTNSFMPSG